MGRPQKYHIKQKISLDKLDWHIKIEQNAKVQQKLYFVRFRYLGDSIEEATSRLGITKRIGYDWQNRWNEKGYEGLLPKSGAGRPSKLSDEDLFELKTILESKGFWTADEVKDLVKDKFDIDYCSNSIRNLLRKICKKYNVRYCLDNRSPGNSEEILKKTWKNK